MNEIEDEMFEGYRDGFADERISFPAVSNRSETYRHGWLNGRDDRLRKPRDCSKNLREEAARLIAEGGRG